MIKRKHILLLMGRYYPKIHRGIAKFARENGWHLNAEPAQSGTIPKGWEGDGIICGCGTVDGMEEFLANHSAKQVFIGSQPNFKKHQIVNIYEDDEQIADLALEHFVQRQFKSFAVYSRNLTKSINKRLVIFSEKADKTGKCKRLIAPKGINWKERHLWLMEELKQLPKPTAIFTKMDEVALEVIEAAADANVSVPNELAVLGVRNDKLVCESSPIPISSIENEHDELGYESAELLNRLMNGEFLEKQTYRRKPKEVIVRQSSDIMAIDHPQVVKALKYIKQNFQYEISVDDITRVTTLSKPGLYKAFQQHLNSTPGKELIRIRLDYAKDLLKRSELSIKEIAIESGFGDYHKFYFTFTREEKMTPKSYRKEKMNVQH